MLRPVECLCFFWSFHGYVLHSFLSFFLVFTVLPFGGCLADITGSTLWISYTVLLVYDAGPLSSFTGFWFPLRMVDLSVFFVSHVCFDGVSNNQGM
jgi:hypothetical protein